MLCERESLFTNSTREPGEICTLFGLAPDAVSVIVFVTVGVGLVELLPPHDSDHAADTSPTSPIESRRAVTPLSYAETQPRFVGGSPDACVSPDATVSPDAHVRRGAI